MITRRLLLGALILAVTAVPAAAQPSQTAAGRIKIASGSAFIVRAGTNLPAQAGQLVFEADTLRTGADGRLGVTLKDDTRVSLGPAAKFGWIGSSTRPPKAAWGSCSTSCAA